MLETSNWKGTWTAIEYVRVGGKDFLMFFEASTGSATIYEVAANGGLGRNVREITGWRNSWSIIEYYY